MLARVRNAALVCLLLATTGAHWAVLQSVAWTTMLAQNLRADCFTQAVTRTFDGQHPCNLCRAIAASKQSEKKADFTSPINPFVFPPAPQGVTLAAPDLEARWPVTDHSAESLSRQPPTPPPRAVLA